MSYTADGYEGYVAQVTYEGQAVYPEAVAAGHGAPVLVWARGLLPASPALLHG